MNDWERQQAKEKREMTALMKAISVHMEEWEVVKDRCCTWYGQLEKVTGEKVGIHRNGERLEASCCFPDDIDGASRSARDWGVIPYGSVQPEIGFTAKKTPKQMANDLTKRLLPSYLPLYDQAVKIKESNQKYYNQLDSEITHIADRVKETVSGDIKDRKIRFSTDSACYGNVTGHPNSFRFDLRGVPYKQALEIAAIIGRLNK